MDISGLELFFILKLDDLRSLFIGGNAVSIVLGIITFVFWDEIILPNKAKKAKILGVSCIACILMAVALPSTKQMAAIIILPNIINNEKVAQIPGRLLDVLGLKLDEMERELTKEGLK